MNATVNSQDAEPYLWHISGHSCFQAIMHVISELKNPGFQNPKTHLLCARALATLQQTETQQHGEFGSSWKVMNQIISKFIAQYPAMSSSQNHLESSAGDDGTQYGNNTVHEASSLSTETNLAGTPTGHPLFAPFSPLGITGLENFDGQIDQLDVGNLDWVSLV